MLSFAENLPAIVKISRDASPRVCRKNHFIMSTFLVFQRIFLLLVVFTLISLELKAINPDSIPVLQELLKKESSAETRVDYLLKLSEGLSRQNPAEAVVYGKEAWQLARQLDDPLLTFKCLISIGYDYNYLGQFDSALFYAKKTYDIDLGDDSMKYLIRLYNLLGSSYSNKINTDSAEYFWDLALKYAIEEQDSVSIAALYGNLGTLASSKGHFQVAYDYMLKTLDYYEKSGKLIQQAIILNNIGHLNQQMGDHQRAIEYTLRAIEINTKLNNLFHLSQNYGNLGISYHRTNQYELAIDYFQKSLKLAGENNFLIDEARALSNLGSVYLDKEDYTKAMQYFEESLELCKEHGFYFGIMTNQNNIGEIHLKQEEYRKAIGYFEDALSMATNYSESEVIRDSYIKLSRAFESLGDFRQSLSFYKKFTAITDSLDQMANKSHIEEMQTRYESEKKELENDQLRIENAAKARVIQTQRIAVIAFIIIVILMWALIYLIFKSREKISKANQQLNELNEKISKQNRQLEETNATKDKLFSIVAHDLRSPFNALLGHLQILMEDFDNFSDDEKKAILEALYNQSNNTFSLLENLLQWAMAQRGQIEYRPKMNEISDLVNAELDFLASRAMKKNIQIINSIPHGIEIWADPAHFKICIRNIVNNSIKFTEHGGKITLEAIRENSNVKISITDTGIGMDEQTLRGIFLPKKSSTRGTDNEMGSGLGLLLVNEFIMMNKAEISVSSNPGKGSTFVLTFPTGNQA